MAELSSHQDLVSSVLQFTHLSFKNTSSSSLSTASSNSSNPQKDKNAESACLNRMGIVTYTVKVNSFIFKFLIYVLTEQLFGIFKNVYKIQQIEEAIGNGASKPAFCCCQPERQLTEHSQNHMLDLKSYFRYFTMSVYVVG